MTDPTDSYSALHEEEMAQQKQFDDQELADRIVALLNPNCPIEGMYYTIPSENDVTASEFVRDGRVVLAMMAKLMFEKGIWLDMEPDGWADRESGDLAIAINTVCVEALDDKGKR